MYNIVIGKLIFNFSCFTFSRGWTGHAMTLRNFHCVQLVWVKVRLGSTVFVVGAGTFCLFPVSLEDYLK